MRNCLLKAWTHLYVCRIWVPSSAGVSAIGWRFCGLDSSPHDGVLCWSDYLIGNCVVNLHFESGCFNTSRNRQNDGTPCIAPALLRRKAEEVKVSFLEHDNWQYCADFQQINGSARSTAKYPKGLTTIIFGSKLFTACKSNNHPRYARAYALDMTGWTVLGLFTYT